MRNVFRGFEMMSMESGTVSVPETSPTQIHLPYNHYRGASDSRSLFLRELLDFLERRPGAVFLGEMSPAKIIFSLISIVAAQAPVLFFFGRSRFFLKKDPARPAEHATTHFTRSPQGRILTLAPTAPRFCLWPLHQATGSKNPSLCANFTLQSE
jgi:hypothetical protein